MSGPLRKGLAILNRLDRLGNSRLPLLLGQVADVLKEFECILCQAMAFGADLTLDDASEQTGFRAEAEPLSSLALYQHRLCGIIRVRASPFACL